MSKMMVHLPLRSLGSSEKCHYFQLDHQQLQSLLSLRLK